VWDTEDGHDRVSYELLDGPSVALDRRARLVEVPRLKRPERLRIERFARCGVSGDVAEEDGDGLAQLALITEGRRTASIVAETDLRCYGLTSWEFRPLVESNASIAWKLLQALAKQLREARAETA